ncbi:hypothetical protein T492DRAFT_1018558 [Pavlovales sp. CCMP2436]|nr:hypothetical protein T492DRAFT_1018558 [Pavlovales sp. CCMP2436]
MLLLLLLLFKRLFLADQPWHASPIGHGGEERGLLLLLLLFSHRIPHGILCRQQEKIILCKTINSCPKKSVPDLRPKSRAKLRPKTPPGTEKNS